VDERERALGSGAARSDLSELSPREWNLPRSVDGVPVLDVLIVGGGQSGLGTAMAPGTSRVCQRDIPDINLTVCQRHLCQVKAHDYGLVPSP
jgi:hypothetical protein